jgi:exosome complex component RRP4
MLSMKDATSDFIARGADLTQFFNLEDYVVVKIVNVTSQKLVDLTTKGPGLRKLYGGRVITVNCNKVPRIIGKQGSMVSLIKNATGCKIIVGQNGIVWLQGEPMSEVIAIQAIKKIEEESHISGLTERVTEFLEKSCGKIEPRESSEEQNDEQSEEAQEEQQEQ